MFQVVHIVQPQPCSTIHSEEPGRHYYGIKDTFRQPINLLTHLFPASHSLSSTALHITSDIYYTNASQYRWSARPRPQPPSSRYRGTHIPQAPAYSLHPSHQRRRTPRVCARSLPHKRAGRGHRRLNDSAEPYALRRHG